MLKGDSRTLPLTRACQCEWKLSIVWDPDPLPGYVPTKPDQNPPNHSDVRPGDAALHRNCFCRAAEAAGVVFVREASWKYLAVCLLQDCNHGNVRVQMASKSCTVGTKPKSG